MVDFWKLTNDEIRRGMDLAHDSALRDQNLMDPMIGFAYDSQLQKVAYWLMECEWDRDLMRLRYADELKELREDRNRTWYAPAGHRRGQLNVIAVGTGVGKSLLFDIESH